MSHTPEPWRAEWQPGQTPNHTYTHCVMCGDDSLCDTLTKADAYRIVACVNALAGVADPAAQVAKWRAIEAAASTLIQEHTGDEKSKCDADMSRAAQWIKSMPPLGPIFQVMVLASLNNSHDKSLDKEVLIELHKFVQDTETHITVMHAILCGKVGIGLVNGELSFHNAKEKP